MNSAEWMKKTVEQQFRSTQHDDDDDDGVLCPSIVMLLAAMVLLSISSDVLGSQNDNSR